MREKAAARKRTKEETDDQFTKLTGVVNEAKETPNLEAIIRKYKFEQARAEKKKAKMTKMEKEGVDFYEEDDISVSEDEFDDEEQRQYADFFAERRKQKEAKEQAESLHEDKPYEAAKEEETNAHEQLERIEKKLDELKPDGERFRDQAMFDQYMDVLDDTDAIHHRIMEDEEAKFDQQILDEEIKQL